MRSARSSRIRREVLKHLAREDPAPISTPGFCCLIRGVTRGQAYAVLQGMVAVGELRQIAEVGRPSWWALTDEARAGIFGDRSRG